MLLLLLIIITSPPLPWASPRGPKPTPLLSSPTSLPPSARPSQSLYSGFKPNYAVTSGTGLTSWDIYGAPARVQCVGVCSVCFGVGRVDEAAEARGSEREAARSKKRAVTIPHHHHHTALPPAPLLARPPPAQARRRSSRLRTRPRARARRQRRTTTRRRARGRRVKGRSRTRATWGGRRAAYEPLAHNQGSLVLLLPSCIICIALAHRRIISQAKKTLPRKYIRETRRARPPPPPFLRRRRRAARGAPILKSGFE